MKLGAIFLFCSLISSVASATEADKLCHKRKSQPGLRCCTKDTIPDGINYGGHWCAGTPTPVEGKSCSLGEFGRGVLWTCSPRSTPVPTKIKPTAPAPVAKTPIAAPENPPPAKVVAAPVVSRMTQLSSRAAGVSQSLHMQDFMAENPGAKTAVLTYLSLDEDAVADLINTINTHAGWQEEAGREFWPQIAIATRDMDLPEVIAELSKVGSPMDLRVRELAKTIATYREKKKWFFIRPFGEMNDGTKVNHWEFGTRPKRNTPAAYAQAWNLLHKAFDEEGATNAIFVFSALAAHNVHHEAEVMKTLELIKPGMIDAYGLNVYSRPHSIYGLSGETYLTFAELVEPWLKLLPSSHHGKLPIAVPEMGVSNEGSAAGKVNWIRNAFAFAKSLEFGMMTYFNFQGDEKGYSVPPETEADSVLHQAINGYCD